MGPEGVIYTNIKEKLADKKNLLGILAVAILLVAVPFTVELVKQQQELRSQASSEPSLEFSGDGVNCDTQGKCTTTNDTIQIDLHSPLGPPADNQ